MKFDRVSCFVIIPFACVSALGASFSAFSIFQLFEVTLVEPTTGDSVAQAAYHSVFGHPWETLDTPFMGLIGACGFFGAVRSFTSLSRLWRYHLPFVFGLLILISALCVTVSAMSVRSVNSTQIWPVPAQVAILTMFGLFALMGTIHRNP